MRETRENHPEVQPKPTERVTVRVVEVEQEVDRRMAITVDDLPLADFGSYTSKQRRALVERWCRLITERELPVTGFFIMRFHRKQPELLAMWREAGIQLGNHTWSHPKLRKVGLDAYLADLNRGHAALVELDLGQSFIPFRYPYLYEGFVGSERDAIRQRLAELDSPIAPITVDTRDWMYARWYRKALERDDTELAERYRRAWRWDLEEATLRSEFWAEQLFGRQPPQILLIHGNELNADHLEGYLDWLVERGYRFISLEEALRDPAYQEPDHSLAPTGDSHWLRLRRSRQL